MDDILFIIPEYDMPRVAKRRPDQVELLSRLVATLQTA